MYDMRRSLLLRGVKEWGCSGIEIYRYRYIRVCVPERLFVYSIIFLRLYNSTTALSIVLNKFFDIQGVCFAPIYF